MKPTIILIFFLVWTKTLFGQEQAGQDSLTNRLTSEITNYDFAETEYIGCYGQKSALYKKVDTLRQNIGLDNFIKLFNTSSVILKYYSFIALISRNSDSALSVLKTLSDTTVTFKLFTAGSNFYETKLITLLTAELLGVCKTKYYYGGGSFKGKTYLHLPKDKKKWRKMKTEIDCLIEQKGLSKTWIKNYCC